MFSWKNGPKIIYNLVIPVPVCPKNFYLGQIKVNRRGDLTDCGVCKEQRSYCEAPFETFGMWNK